MFLHVKQQIPAFADRKKIDRFSRRLEERIVGAEHVLAALANTLGDRPIAAFGNQGPGAHHGWRANSL